jgi:hypothetical protein
MNDPEFLKAFHDCTLSSEDFRHRDHLRLAWLVLRRHGLEETLPLLSNGIRNYAFSKGATTKYNETLTQFWIRLMNHAIQTKDSPGEFDQLLNAFPILQNKQVPFQHWRPETLNSDVARSNWVEPDLLPLPF